jgi:putative transposase
MSKTKNELGNLYKKEINPMVKERLLLVLRVKGDGELPVRVVKELHRSNPWASDWLKRYDEEGVDGLKNRPKSGRPPKLSPEIALRIRKKLTEGKQGWTTRQVNEMIVRDGNVKYHYNHIFRILHKWGFKQKVPRKVHVNTASQEEKGSFKKEPRRS